MSDECDPTRLSEMRGDLLYEQGEGLREGREKVGEI